MSFLQAKCTFTNLKNITYLNTGVLDSDPALQSVISGESNKSRVLKFASVCSLRDDDLVKVVEAMPLIRDLDISYPGNDRAPLVWLGGGLGELI